QWYRRACRQHVAGRSSDGDESSQRPRHVHQHQNGKAIWHQPDDQPDDAHAGAAKQGHRRPQCFCALFRHPPGWLPEAHRELRDHQPCGCRCRHFLHITYSPLCSPNISRVRIFCLSVTLSSMKKPGTIAVLFCACSVFSCEYNSTTPETGYIKATIDGVQSTYTSPDVLGTVYYAQANEFHIAFY